jgi:hypothetical protein
LGERKGTTGKSVTYTSLALNIFILQATTGEDCTNQACARLKKGMISNLEILILEKNLQYQEISYRFGQNYFIQDEKV